MKQTQADKKGSSRKMQKSAKLMYKNQHTKEQKGYKNVNYYSKFFFAAKLELQFMNSFSGSDIL